MSKIRSFEKNLYEMLLSKIDNQGLFPEKWEDFILPLREQVSHAGILNEVERKTLWQSGTSFKIGCLLIQDKKLNNHDLPENAIETGGMQLIIYGTFLQLREWVTKINTEKRGLRILGQIKEYIAQNKELSELRNAIAHSGGNNKSTYFYYSKEQTIEFKTKKALISTRLTYLRSSLHLYYYGLYFQNGV